MKLQLKINWIGPSSHEWEIMLPAKFEVCHRCKGTGKHVNPAIDGHGISPEEFANDPDFEEAYFSGVYDVRCEKCDGNKVIKIVDENKLTKRQKLIFDDYYIQKTKYYEEIASESRWGY